MAGDTQSATLSVTYRKTTRRSVLASVGTGLIGGFTGCTDAVRKSVQPNTATPFPSEKSITTPIETPLDTPSTAQRKAGNTPEPANTTPQPMPDFDAAKLEGIDNVHLVERAIRAEATRARGFRPEWKQYIAYAARVHSRDMGVNGYFAHETLENVEPEEQVKQFMIGRDSTIKCNFAGQNILRYRSIADYYKKVGPKPVAEDVIDSFLDSKLHRKLLLAKGNDYEGIGVYFDREENMYVTHNFVACE